MWRRLFKKFLHVLVTRLLRLVKFKVGIPGEENRDVLAFKINFLTYHCPR